MMRLRAPRTRYDGIMLAMGVVALALGAHSLYWGHASTQWPRREATITASKVRYASKGVNLDVRYAYDCDGRPCTGNRWHYRIFSSAPDDIWVSGRGKRVEAAAARFPVGARVEVAVKPGDPGESVLEPGMSSDDATVAAGGLLLILLAFLGTRREAVVGRVPAGSARDASPNPVVRARLGEPPR